MINSKINDPKIKNDWVSVPLVRLSRDRVNSVP